MDKCKINLIQSYETEVDSNSELDRIISTQSFKDKLTSELFERNLDTFRTVSERPITTPDLFRSQAQDEKHIDYRVSADEHHINQQIGKAIGIGKIISSVFNINVASDSIEERIVAKIEKQIENLSKNIDKRFDDLSKQFSELNTRFGKVCIDDRDSLIFRQLVFELRILAINKAFPEAKLPKPGFSSDQTYAKPNGDFDYQKFDEDYMKFEKRMREEKMSESTHDLNRLFNYKLIEFNAKVNRPFICYENSEIVKALESKYDMSIEDPSATNLPLVRFYRDWLDSQRSVQQ